MSFPIYARALLILTLMVVSVPFSSEQPPELEPGVFYCYACSYREVGGRQNDNPKCKENAAVQGGYGPCGPIGEDGIGCFTFKATYASNGKEYSVWGRTCSPPGSPTSGCKNEPPAGLSPEPGVQVKDVQTCYCNKNLCNDFVPSGLKSTGVATVETFSLILLICCSLRH